MVTCVAHNHKTENDFGGSNPSLATNFKSMKKLLWLDDCRNPFENDWLNFSPIGKNVEVHWVKSYDEFIKWITDNGVPDAVCFDHDLGYRIDPNSEVSYHNGEISAYSLLPYDEEEKTGYDCAKALGYLCTELNVPYPLYNIQSANPVGKANIKCYIENFKLYNKTL